MDFGSLLTHAQKNEQQPKKEIKYYSTKFEPPKKEERSKQLSDNIKKFLARKEAEEKQRAKDAKHKKEELLALRSQDRKATRRVAVMLKRTKSANKSVIQDAVDNDNTAVTLAGPSQPDEDDYGYVSQEASAFYNKMMQKYSTMPDEEKFPKAKKNVNTNLKEIKDRVRAAIEREQEEALLPHKRKRKPKEVVEQPEPVEEEKQEEKPKPKPRPAAPPPMNFNELLKLAQKKQFEPIKIEPKIEKDDERPMTKRQKREFEKEREWKERKEKGERNGTSIASSSGNTSMGPAPNKIPKLNSSSTNGKIPKIPSSDERKPQNPIPKPIPKKPDDRPNIPRKPDDRVPKSRDERINLPKKSDDRTSLPKKSEIKYTNGVQNQSASSDRKPISNSSKESKLRAELEKSRTVNKPPPTKLNDKPPSSKPSLDKQKALVRKDMNSRDIKGRPLSDRPKQIPPADIKPKQFPPADIKPKQYLPGDVRAKQFPPGDVRPKQFPPSDVRPKQFPPSDVRPKQFPPSDVRPKQFPPGDVRPKQFPPSDVRPKQFPPADLRSKQFPPPDVRRRPKDAKRKPPPMGHKRRILDDDDSEYDSEMDDFIDDGPEGAEDYSKYISEIFGYDKNKYRHIDDEVDNMESSFSQVMREEFISSKIGLMEDLEDMRIEAEEKKKKTMMKKKMK